MSIRTFWIFLLKLLGLWMLFDSLPLIPEAIGNAAMPFHGLSGTEYFIMIGLVILTLALWFIILRLFVFRPQWLLDKLKLDQGFTEEKIDLNIGTKTVITIACIVIGALLLINTLPGLCRNFFLFLRNRLIFSQDPNTPWLIVDVVKVVIGYLLMTNSKPVANFIEKQRTKGNDNENQ